MAAFSELQDYIFSYIQTYNYGWSDIYFMYIQEDNPEQWIMARLYKPFETIGYKIKKVYCDGKVIYDCDDDETK